MRFLRNEGLPSELSYSNSTSNGTMGGPHVSGRQGI